MEQFVKMGREAACLSSATLQVSYCASMVIGYAILQRDYAIYTVSPFNLPNRCFMRVFFRSLSRNIT